MQHYTNYRGEINQVNRLYKLPTAPHYSLTQFLNPTIIWPFVRLIDTLKNFCSRKVFNLINGSQYTGTNDSRVEKLIVLRHVDELPPGTATDV